MVPRAMEYSVSRPGDMRLKDHGGGGYMELAEFLLQGLSL